MATSRPYLPGSLHPRSADDKRLKGREVESGKDRLTVEVPADLRGETVLVIERKMLPQVISLAESVWKPRTSGFNINAETLWLPFSLSISSANDVLMKKTNCMVELG